MTFIKSLELKFDKDFFQKFAVAIASAAGAAALSAGVQTAVTFLASDPKYAAYAIVVSALAAALGYKKPA